MKTKILTAILTLGVSTGFTTANADFIYEVKYTTVGCPDSMKAMLFAKTGKIRSEAGCKSILAGERLIHKGSTQPKLTNENLIKLNNNAEGIDAFEGYFTGRDIFFVEAIGTQTTPQPSNTKNSQ
ncbi:hypothetical protein [Thiomicrorhabdus aquaedulcis]|uniref:hypothetical protein n=1 Tax=Thiomicrorhabdus aquaedulcis TaxID=2211106 RepID=UPI000FD6FD4B|nr:hypothetical protein [Thiomicrorhabdus aquaedulcis]